MPRAAGIGVGAFLYPKLDGIEGDPKGFSNRFIIDRTLATCREINVRCVHLRPDSSLWKLGERTRSPPQRGNQSSGRRPS
jgi:hypothetical protein